MSIDQIQRALEAVKHPISSSLSLPPPCYHDREWLDHELKHIFKKGWFSVGRADHWQKPGDYQSIDIAGIPIVIIMDENSRLHALSNSCLHRSSQIMSGGGNCRAMVCPFHGWSYDCRGQLISAARMETAESFCEREQRLRNFNIAVADGFVFLSLERSPDPLEQWLGDFSGMHLPWSMDSLVTSRRRSFDVNCNWKMFIEVFNEYYHLPHVHPDSISHYYPEPEAPDAVIGEYTTQFGATVKNPGLLESGQHDAFPVIKTLGEKEKNGTRYTWVFPNLTFAASMDCMWVYHVYPVSADRTHAVQTICFPAQTVKRDDFEDSAPSYYRRLDFAIDEDIAALEMQQTGIASPFAVQGRFSALEPSVGNFACWYSRVIRN